LSRVVNDQDLAASVTAALLQHPHVRDVELVGSRATGSSTPLSDWDFVVVTDRFGEVARALPTLVPRLDPLAQQWDRISEYPCYMLMLRGPVKVDLIFPEEPYESLPPWTVTVETLDGIDRHFWDWILWLASKREKRQDELVRRELAKMSVHLLRPLGVDRVPGSIEDALDSYLSARDRRERELGVEVSRRLEHEVLPAIGRTRPRRGDCG
jgi:hypothetical protein